MTGLTRRTSLAKKRAKPRRLPPVLCSMRGCKRPPRAAGFCKTHAQREADRLFSLWVRARDGVCTARDMFPEIGCNGALQTMHLASRRYHATRWDERNAAAGCAAHHLMLTHEPLRHSMFCESFDGWRNVRWQALHGEPQDAGEVIERYHEAAVA